MSRQEYYKKLLQKTKKQYERVREVYCPCLNTFVCFNARGFHHLKYELSEKGRKVKEKIYKLRAFPFVIPVLKKARLVKYHKRGKIFIGRGKKRKKREVEYWVLKEDVKYWRHSIKVILIKIGKSEKIIFWSVM